MSGSGKSALIQPLVTKAIQAGYDVYVIDPIKGAADFKYAEPWLAGIAVDIFSAAELLKWIYANVVEKTRDLNSRFGTASFDQLPEKYRPRRTLIVVDEFTSLISTAKLPSKSKNADIMAERDAVEADNDARVSLGQMIAKMGREARSAGVVLVLGTQKLSAKMLDDVGGDSLKINLSRILLGKVSDGDRMSALKDPQATPKPNTSDDVSLPKGRGVVELSRKVAVIQTWWSPTSEHVTFLNETPLPTKAKWKSAHVRPTIRLSAEGLCKFAFSSADLPVGFDWVEEDGIWFPMDLLGALGSVGRRVVVVGAPPGSNDAFFDSIRGVSFESDGETEPFDGVYDFDTLKAKCATTAVKESNKVASGPVFTPPVGVTVSDTAWSPGMKATGAEPVARPVVKLSGGLLAPPSGAPVETSLPAPVEAYIPVDGVVAMTDGWV
jgi:hypothetical protein